MLQKKYAGASDAAVPVEVGVGRLGAEKEWAAAALISGRDGSQSGEQIALGFLLVAGSLRLNQSVPGCEN